MQLSTFALALAIAATLVGVGVFSLGVSAIWRTVAVGGPAPERRAQPWRRTWLMLKALLGHGRFQHRPMVKVAHWAVMVSFPVLFLTLASAYGQLVDPRFTLPLVGRWAPLEILTEAIAWLSLVGIVALIVLRQVTHPRRGRSSRFFGSNMGQAYLVEAVVLVVVVAVLLLRGLEFALEHGGWALDGSTAEATLEAGNGLVPFVPGHYPLTAWFGQAFTGWPTERIETAIVVVALVKILASMSWMVIVGMRPAMGVSWHRFLAVVNVWARREVDGRPALGPVPPVRAGGPGGGAVVDFEQVDALPDGARLGVGRIEDFTWKGLLDFSTCTECGRCQEQCPAWNTGKPLSPKLVVMALRDHAYASAPYLRVAANGSTEPAGHTATTGHVPVPGLGGDADAGSHAGVDVLTLVGDVVDPAALWDCTMCGACVQQCPVDIEHVDHIVDLRRNQVLMESAFPAELGSMFTKIEKQGNPWGLPARQRLAWAKDLPFAVPVVGADLEDASGVDYLFWVGCAGAYEDRAKKTSRAVAELLHMADVSFAVLGTGESCTGDPARRAGNEFLFQMLAQANVEALTAARPQKIVVTCAHCFNTIAREYPQVGGRFDVVHHTELLDALVREGRLTPVPRGVGAGGAGAGGAGAGGDASPSDVVTYHDPCFLGRHNQIYTPPRDLIAALPGVQLVEMPRTGERSFCCGGGGARVWMEETTGTRIGTARAAEAVATGAGTIATACPFCTVMLTDGVAAQPAGSWSAGASGSGAGGSGAGGSGAGGSGGAGGSAGAGASGPVAVVDVAQLLLDAVRTGD
ncbi:(Fe-S)-binding protein [Actinotalea sp.]|uniref:(Fe-S)-binding protein n=1 Tax=Actinotalea sp. TaxID=1872145 RepID=UPI002B960885|nr:(Fe-S)-binding protein [Actinotalea sp.]HRA50080.1 (Fe-S)-binding protein [Actinotalea sp.]